MAHLHFSFSSAATGSLSLGGAAPTNFIMAIPQPVAPEWVQCRSASGSMLVQHAHSNSLHSNSPSSELLQVSDQPVILHPVLVVSWDPSRPWGGPVAQHSQAADVQFCQGRLRYPHSCCRGCGALASNQRINKLSSRQACAAGTSKPLSKDLQLPQLAQSKPHCHTVG